MVNAKNKITPQIARLYIGQKATRHADGAVFTIEDVSQWSIGDGDRIRSNYGLFTLHLRPLESITESEARQIYLIYFGDEYPDGYSRTAKEWFLLLREFSPLMFLKLLEMGFDLFGLITSGLAKEVPLQS